MCNRRDRKTLLPIIERKCEAGSEIHYYEWAAYWCLLSRGFVYKYVIKCYMSMQIQEPL